MIIFYIYNINCVFSSYLGPGLKSFLHYFVMCMLNHRNSEIIIIIVTLGVEIPHAIQPLFDMT